MSILLSGNKVVKCIVKGLQLLLMVLALLERICLPKKPHYLPHSIKNVKLPIKTYTQLYMVQIKMYSTSPSSHQ